ncbi:MAG: DNA-3-methyladenine glycosylase 2 family protein [Eubacteriaceae bacterium]|nr:DNA-3-methyladenine glycosylase 2 family protein [Eubacteriaceae bacterium]
MDRMFDSRSQLVFEGIGDFDVVKAFDSGQTFRFRQTSQNSVEGIVGGQLLGLAQEGERITATFETGAFDKQQLFSYLAFDVDYKYILGQINTDEIMSGALKSGKGIRVLRQDLWECLITFILSQNNNIPRIASLVQSLCAALGEPFGSDQYFAFPTPQQVLSGGMDVLSKLKMGYRDEYVYLAAKLVAEGDLDLKALAAKETKDAKTSLMGLKGVGSKVADCVLLFGMARYEVCPHDVWVKKVFSERYGFGQVSEKQTYGFAKEKWGAYAGIAQQFLFYHERNDKASKGT